MHTLLHTSKHMYAIRHVMLKAQLMQICTWACYINIHETRNIDEMAEGERNVL